MKNIIESMSMTVLKLPRNVQIYKEYFTFSQLDFLSDVGGFLGLFLGLSLFAIHDLIVKGLKTIFTSVHEKINLV